MAATTHTNLYHLTTPTGSFQDWYRHNFNGQTYFWVLDGDVFCHSPLELADEGIVAFDGIDECHLDYNNVRVYTDIETGAEPALVIESVEVAREDVRFEDYVYMNDSLYMKLTEEHDYEGRVRMNVMRLVGKN